MIISSKFYLLYIFQVRIAGVVLQVGAWLVEAAMRGSLPSLPFVNHITVTHDKEYCLLGMQENNAIYF